VGQQAGGEVPGRGGKPPVDPPDSEVFLLKRIRYVDDDAVSIEESWVPVGLIPDPDAIGISLYDYFRSQNIFPQRTRSRVSARMPDSEFQAHIKMDEKIPVLVIKQVALDQAAPAD
jgi:DNA-binding GntR family transcriptional regulator